VGIAYVSIHQCMLTYALLRVGIAYVSIRQRMLTYALLRVGDLQMPSVAPVSDEEALCTEGGC
jgi:hypothetical protein